MKRDGVHFEHAETKASDMPPARVLISPDESLRIARKGQHPNTASRGGLRTRPLGLPAKVSVYRGLNQLGLRGANGGVDRSGKPRAVTGICPSGNAFLSRWELNFPFRGIFWNDPSPELRQARNMALGMPEEHQQK